MPVNRSRYTSLSHVIRGHYSWFVTFLLLVTNPASAAQVCGQIENLKDRAGSGCLEMGVGTGSIAIQVYFHKPISYQKDSPILIVIPGAGRNADDYRDSWIAAAEKFNILILSPSYPESDYDFAAYHMGGTVRDLVIRGDTDPDASVFRLPDNGISVTFNEDEGAWLFHDFDKIFQAVSAVLNSSRDSYDLFGHSAGGQILHRFALFVESSSADRIVAGNSGFYTQADLEIPIPFGLQGTTVDEIRLQKAFERNLILLLGELDNESETRGTMLHTPTVDSHGLGRLERGRYFFEASREQATNVDAQFVWQLEIVPDVGHDYRRMAIAAAELLYGE